MLDLCCGPGRHVLEFARRGFRVTGVDRTQRYLEAARATALSEGLAVELVQADMRDFSRPPTFDLALNLFSSFGYFAEAADDLQVLKNLNASLAPGARVRDSDLASICRTRRVLARRAYRSRWMGNN